MSTLEHSTKDPHEVSSTNTSMVTKDNCQGSANLPSPKTLNRGNNQPAPDEPESMNKNERTNTQYAPDDPAATPITSTTTATKNKWLQKMEDRITQVLKTGRLTRAFRQGFRLWATYEEENPPRYRSSVERCDNIDLLTDHYIQMYEYGRKTNDKQEMRQILTQAWKAYAAKQVIDQLGQNYVPSSIDYKFLRIHETLKNVNTSYDEYV